LACAGLVRKLVFIDFPSGIAAAKLEFPASPLVGSYLFAGSALRIPKTKLGEVLILEVMHAAVVKC